MSTFQVVALKPFSGTSKANRPYNMLIVKGVFTNNDGVVDTGELVFMESRDRRLPSLTAGAKYEPVIEIYINREGKLTPQITELKPLKAA